MVTEPRSAGQTPVSAGTARGTDGPGGTAAVQKAADDVKSEGKRLAKEGQAAAHRLVKDQQGIAADYLRAVAAAIDSGANELDSQGHGTTASYVSRTADEAKDLIDRFAQRDPGELLQEVQSFARQRPALFFGAAFLVGFAATRFLKASASEARPEGTSTQGRMTSSYGTTPAQSAGPQQRSGTTQGQATGATQGTGASSFSSGTTPPVKTTPSDTRRI